MLLPGRFRRFGQHGWPHGEKPVEEGNYRLRGDWFPFEVFVYQ